MAATRIDCDIHPAVGGTRTTLLPYLDDHWKEQVVSRAIDGLDLNSYPPNMRSISSSSLSMSSSIRWFLVFGASAPRILFSAFSTESLVVSAMAASPGVGWSMTTRH